MCSEDLATRGFGRKERRATITCSPQGDNQVLRGSLKARKIGIAVA